MNRKNIGMLGVAIVALAILTAPALAGSCSGGKSDIVDTAAKAGNFETLITALKAADLVEALRGEGPFTVFAPTDEAFAKLPQDLVASLLEPENKDKLTAVLTYHVVSGSIYSSDVRPGHVETLQGGQITVSKDSGDLRIDQAGLVATDIETSNGVIHVIDQVILPQQMRASLGAPGNDWAANRR